ncbi:Son of sevenless 2 [Clarias magur]|uniref:Son of sevenless 2 n=1 Tax=Clarias magur TaxID=1594786 RepID=A0A8J4TF82_CLAMG|nr:Son of sevenless 2 [Clarias magur]
MSKRSQCWRRATESRLSVDHTMTAHCSCLPGHVATGAEEKPTTCGLQLSVHLSISKSGPNSPPTPSSPPILVAHSGSV